MSIDDESRDPSEATTLIGQSTRTPLTTCPECATARATDDPFCEQCGHDFTLAARRWTLDVGADRGYYERFRPEGVEFPASAPTRRYPLQQREILVGRSHGDHTPDVDLSGPLDDPGASRRQVLLVRGEAGYSAIDLGSTNGTFLNDATDPMEPHRATPLGDGDRLHVGAWTTLVLHAEPDDQP
jgi:hypothetical protein